MASFLFRLLALLLVLWLLRRVLGSILGGPKQPSPKESPQSVSNNMVKDPVCGMYMDSRLALRLEDPKEEFYFCSEECRNKYLDKSSEEEARTARPM